jgi:ABC-type multidrug transport system ATPase subunit
MPAPSPLEIRDVTKEYRGLIALDRITLDFPAGQLVALVGHNGAGKSTLLAISAGLLEPDDGEVLVAGNIAGSLEARAELSYAGDTPILYDDLSVWEHLEYVAGLHGVTDCQGPATELVERFDLLSRADDLPSRFSRGMRQKAALAAALIRPASVLLVDEPFVGLDVPAQAALTEVLVARARAGTTVLVATHQPAFLGHVDRCVLLRDGTLSHDGPPTDALVRALQGDG